MDGILSGTIVHFVDEVAGDYHEHVHKPALIQDAYAAHLNQGHVHLRVFEADPRDDRAVDAFYSAGHEPGTWHWIGEQHSQEQEQAPTYQCGARVGCLAQGVSFTGVIEQAGPGGLYHVEAEIDGGRTIPLFVQEQEILGLAAERETTT